jgi:hypothetical protein
MYWKLSRARRGPRSKTTKWRLTGGKRSCGGEDGRAQGCNTLHVPFLFRQLSSNRQGEYDDSLMSNTQHYFDHVWGGYNDDGFGARAEHRGGGFSSPWSTGAGSGAGHGATACPGAAGMTACPGTAGMTACPGMAGAGVAGTVGGTTAAGITGTRRRRKRRLRRNTRPVAVLTK